MKQITYILGLLLILSSLSCEKIEEILPPQKFKAKDFPISIGTYWEYQWYDVLRGPIDTMRGTIVSSGLSINGKDDLWGLEWKTKNGSRRVDTQYVQYGDNYIRFYKHDSFRDSLLLESQYEFPFQVGDEWTLENNQGTYQVLNDRHDVSGYIDSEEFGKGIYLQRRAFGENNFSTHDNIVLEKDIGVIWRNFNITRGIPMQIELFELIDYHIN